MHACQGTRSTIGVFSAREEKKISKPNDRFRSCVLLVMSQARFHLRHIGGSEMTLWFLFHLNTAQEKKLVVC